MDKLAKYYHLCAVRSKPLQHYYNRVKGLDIYTKEQQTLLFVEVEGTYKIREHIIGADDEDASGGKIEVY